MPEKYDDDVLYDNWPTGEREETNLSNSFKKDSQIQEKNEQYDTYSDVLSVKSIENHLQQENIPRNVNDKIGIFRSKESEERRSMHVIYAHKKYKV